MLPVEGIKDLQKEVESIPVAISISPKGFNLVVDTLHLSRANLVDRMVDNSVEVIFQEFSEPHETLVVGVVATVDSGADIERHIPYGIGMVCLGHHFLDQVSHKEKLVFLQQLVIELRILCILFVGIVMVVKILLFQRGSIGGKDEPRPLEALGLFGPAFPEELGLNIFSYSTDDLVVEILDDVEVVEDDLDVRTFFLESLLEIGIHVAGDCDDV